MSKCDIKLTGSVRVVELHVSICAPLIHRPTIHRTGELFTFNPLVRKIPQSTRCAHGVITRAQYGYAGVILEAVMTYHAHLVFFFNQSLEPLV